LGKNNLDSSIALRWNQLPKNSNMKSIIWRKVERRKCEKKIKK